MIENKYGKIFYVHQWGHVFSCNMHMTREGICSIKYNDDEMVYRDIIMCLKIIDIYSAVLVISDSLY